MTTAAPSGEAATVAPAGAAGAQGSPSADPARGAAVEVAVLGPAPGPYSYAVPAGLRARLAIGARVLVPLGGQRNVEGVVLRVLGQDEAVASAPRRRAPGAGTSPPRVELRSVSQILDGPRLPRDLLGLAGFIADYYLAPPGEALRLVLPSYEQARVAEQAVLSDAGRGLAAALAGALLSPAAAARAEVLSPVEQHTLRGLLLREQRVRRKAAVSLDTLAKDLAEGAPPALKLKPADVTAALRRLATAELVELRERIAAGVKARGPLDAARVMLDAPTPADSAEPPTLTDEQKNALDELLLGLDGSLEVARTGAAPASGYRGFLLHGVTGSGKTELYLRLIAAALERGRTALVLVPEIALTPQLLQRFVARFGDEIAVLHSALSSGQRAEAWRRLLTGQVRIALGPRSALFAPLGQLGVIIVDEEHDPSFKQQDGVRYHGRDVALWRAQQAGAVAVLGSATPSLESLDLARRGKLTQLTLKKRATGLPLPEVQVVDLKQYILPKVKAPLGSEPPIEGVPAEERALLSAPLRQALSETLAAGEQAILFLNRRGYATFLLCKACGYRLECPYCAVTLTWHKGDDRLSCHYCGHTTPATEKCPVCLSPSVQRLGLGTEKLTEQIKTCFPDARVARLDRDTSGELAALLSRMHRREIDILIGTQMLAKGHDFPGVTLVGVVLADTGMGLPDFRASERTFQLLAQVAGRAGRKERPGRVLIQTYNPDHPAVKFACTHDYVSFAEQELLTRQAPFYFPPVVRLGLLRIDGADALEVRAAALHVAEQVKKLCARAPAEARLMMLGPAEAPLSRLKGRTRWQLLLRAATSKALRAVLRGALATPLSRTLRLSVDVDPVSTL